jgi:L-rhamnose-H+ transport protein
MSNSLVIGFALTVLGAICAGALGLLLRLQVRYSWENTWLVSQLVTMIVLPTCAAGLFLHRWIAAIASVGAPHVILIVVFGFLWGIGSVAFAIGIERVGLSLGFATIMGVVTALGAGIPIVRRWQGIPPQARLVTLCGIALCLLGVGLYGRAGVLRERGDARVPAGQEAASRGSGAILIGLGWCLLSGTFSACSNIGFDFAAPVARVLENAGADPLLASVVRWIPVFWGGYVAVLLFSTSPLLRNKTWKNFTAPGTGLDFLRAVGLGALSFFGQILYGMGASKLGMLGTSVGYAAFLAVSILAALVFGFMLKEWKQAPRQSLHVLYAGVTVLVVAVLLLAYGNSLIT